MKSSFLICPVCETENEAGTKNCILCGAPLPLAVSPPSSPSSAPPPPRSPATTAPPPSIASPPTSSAAVRSSLASPFSEIEQALDELLPLPEVLDENPLSPSGLPSPPLVSPPSPQTPPPPQTLRPPTSTSSGSLATSAPLSKRTSDSELFPGVPAPAKPTGVSGSQPAFSASRGAASPIPRGATPPPESSRSGGFSRSQMPALEIPEPGTLCLIVYFQRKPAQYFPVVYDEILIGRTDPASNAYPDLDLTPFDPELAISRKHSYVYREQNSYYIYPISNSGTQVNQEMVDLGTKRLLKEGDVVILSGRLAIRFARVG